VLRDLQRRCDVGEDEDGEEVVVSSFGEAGEDGDQQWLPVVREQFRDRRLAVLGLLRNLFLLGKELRALGCVEPNVETHGGEHDAQEEGMRQPQVVKASPVNTPASATAAVPRSSPQDTPICGQEP
jgi:hypothetical protein